METAQGAPLELRKWVGCRLAIDRALRGSDKPRCRHQFVSKAEIFAETNVPKNDADAETICRNNLQKREKVSQSDTLLYQKDTNLVQ